MLYLKFGWIVIEMMVSEVTICQIVQHGRAWNWGIPHKMAIWVGRWWGTMVWFHFISWCESWGLRHSWLSQKSLHVLDSSGHMTDMATQVATCYLMPVWILFVFPRNVSWAYSNLKYPLVICYTAMVNCLFIVYLSINHGDLSIAFTVSDYQRVTG